MFHIWIPCCRPWFYNSLPEDISIGSPVKWDRGTDCQVKKWQSGCMQRPHVLAASETNPQSALDVRDGRWGFGCWCKYGRPTFGWKQTISEGLWKPKYNARHCLSLALHEKLRHLMAHGTSWSILEIMEYHGTSWNSMSQPGLSTPGNRYLGWVDERPAPKIYWWSRKHQETIRASDTCIWRNPEPFGIAEQGHSDDIDHRFTFHFPHHRPWIHHWDLKKKKPRAVYTTPKHIVRHTWTFAI